MLTFGCTRQCLNKFRHCSHLHESWTLLSLLMPFKFDTRFVQQIRASSGSISDNIAEGFERQGNKEFIQFLYIAKGSCGEFRSQINRAFDAGFIDQDTYNQMYNDCKKLGAGILNFIQSLKNFESKGSKFMG